MKYKDRNHDVCMSVCVSLCVQPLITMLEGRGCMAHMCPSSVKMFPVLNVWLRDTFIGIWTGLFCKADMSSTHVVQSWEADTWGFPDKVVHTWPQAFETYMPPSALISPGGSGVGGERGTEERCRKRGNWWKVGLFHSSLEMLSLACSVCWFPHGFQMLSWSALT